MNSTMRPIVFAFVFAFSWFSYAHPSQLEVQSWSFDFLQKNRNVSKQWKDSVVWQETLCRRSYYNYLIRLDTTVKDIQFKLTPEGRIFVDAWFKDLYAYVDGTHKSSYSACVPISGWLGASTENARVLAIIDIGEDVDLKDLRIRITATRIGRLDIGGAWVVPNWFRDFLTRLTNRALGYMWSSELGEWINEKITEEFQKKIPK